MANTNAPLGFAPRSADVAYASCNRYTLYTGETTKDGDVLYMRAADGLLTGTYDATYPIVGIQNGGILNPSPGSTKAVLDTAVAGSTVRVWDDPNTVFVGQISSYSATDPVTTWTPTSRYDISGSAGAQYINASSSSNDQIQVLRLSKEYDTGKYSAVGAYAKVEFVLAPAKCLRSRES